MPDYVYNLSNKIVNSDPANTRSGIGNLFAGSSNTQMERLIGKWFLGNDRPMAATGTAYQYVSGSLFQGGISNTDIHQGGLGDCYFMASLATTAQRSGSTISNIFTDNYDGTLTVRFYNNGVADYVTVDRYLPVDTSGNAYYAGWGGGRYDNSNNELWVALAEKAYAQINESGWLGQETSANAYAEIDHGNSGVALRQITAHSTTGYGVSSISDKNTLISKINAGQMIVLNTLDVLPASSTLVADHSYAVTGYNSMTGRFSLYNPHGTNHASLTWSEISANFEWWDATV
jgi:hypothetical protein